MQLISSLRDEVAFDAGFRPDELDRGAQSAQAIRHAERGDRVSPRASAGYKNPWRFFWV